MAKKQADIGTAQAHVGAPHNQPFNIHGKRGKKVKSWWNGHRSSTKTRKSDD